MEMRDWEGDDGEKGLVEERLLQDQEFDASEKELKGGSKRTTRSTLWMILSVTATLTGRRTLRGGFREFFLVMG